MVKKGSQPAVCRLAVSNGDSKNAASGPHRYRSERVFDLPERGSVLENAADQKERTGGDGFDDPLRNVCDQNRFRGDDRLNWRVLDLSRGKHRDGTVMMLVIGIAVDELMNRRTDREQCSPLKHDCNKQGAAGFSGRRRVEMPGYPVRCCAFFVHDRTGVRGVDLNQAGV
jgi:hypothetical protein